jgi:hypothetical protein
MTRRGECRSAFLKRLEVSRDVVAGGVAGGLCAGARRQRSRASRSAGGGPVRGGLDAGEQRRRVAAQAQAGRSLLSTARRQLKQRLQRCRQLGCHPVRLHQGSRTPRLSWRGGVADRAPTNGWHRQGRRGECAVTGESPARDRRSASVCGYAVVETPRTVHYAMIPTAARRSVEPTDNHQTGPRASCTAQRSGRWRRCLSAARRWTSMCPL